MENGVKNGQMQNEHADSSPLRQRIGGTKSPEKSPRKYPEGHCEKYHCHFEDLPAWLKDNEHIHYFYRRPEISYAKCFQSLFRLHSETGNIW